MNSCPEFHCPVITDLYYLFMLQGQHGHCPPPKRLIPGASCPPLNLWCELPLLLILATRLPMKDKMPGPWHRKRFSELVTKGEKKDFFPLELVFQTMKHHLTLCRQVVHRVEFIWSDHLLSSESHKRKIAMSRALNCFGESNWNWTDCGFEVSTSLSFTIKGM